MPVQVLQVVRRQHEDLPVPGHVREEDDLLRVSRFEQALHRLKLVSRLRVLLARISTK